MARRKTDARSRSSNKNRVHVKFWELAPPDYILRYMQAREIASAKRAAKAARRKAVTMPVFSFTGKPY